VTYKSFPDHWNVVVESLQGAWIVVYVPPSHTMERYHEADRYADKRTATGHALRRQRLALRDAFQFGHWIQRVARNGSRTRVPAW
jgi:hypothetical protein